MTGTAVLLAAGQRLWWDADHEPVIEAGTVARLVADHGVTGVTAGSMLGVAEARHVADLLHPIWDATCGVDGWLTVQLPHGTAHHGEAIVDAARALHADIDRPNTLVGVPATSAGCWAIEQLTFAGVPVNASLIFHPMQHWFFAESYLRGIERRMANARSPRVAAAASACISSWDAAVNPLLPVEWRDRSGLGLAVDIAHEREAGLATRRWARLAAAGADAPRLVWTRTAVEDEALSPTYYVEQLPTAGTVNCLRTSTLRSLGRAERLRLRPMTREEAGGVTGALTASGIEEERLGEDLQWQALAAA